MLEMAWPGPSQNQTRTRSRSPTRTGSQRRRVSSDAFLAVLTEGCIGTRQVLKNIAVQTWKKNQASEPCTNALS